MPTPTAHDKLKAGVARSLADRGLAPKQDAPTPPAERPVTSTDRISAGVKKHFDELTKQAGRTPEAAERLDRFAPGSALAKIAAGVGRMCETEEQRVAREAAEAAAQRDELDDAETQLSRALETVRAAKARFELTPDDVAANTAAGLGPR